MSSKKRIVAGLMAGVMVSSAVIPAFAAESSRKKEEVIYVNLDAAGSVKEIYAVNIFGKGSVVDYGDYSAVEMLNTTDEISQNGDKISFSTDSGRVYYKGKMNSNEIPWNISVKYYLDGKEYTAEELAGKSGNLKITFKITENKAVGKNFYKNYALQASFTLDTEKCSGIHAENATIANVGSDKQISYTILPGEGIDASITADVTDFEMPAVSINGISLSLDVEVDDEELMDQVKDLLDAIERIDDGTGELKDGVSDLRDGAEGDLRNGVNELKDGADQLQEGVSDLKEGGSDLNDGALGLRDGASDLKNGVSALNDGAAGLKNGASQLDDGVNSLNSGILEIQKGLEQLNSQSSFLTEGSAAVYDALLRIQSALSGVSASSDDISQLVDASSQIKNGIDELTEGAALLEENISFEAYKSVMKENGLDIDELKAGNTAAIEQLSDTADSLNTAISNIRNKLPQKVQDQLKKEGIDLDEIQEEVDQLNALVLLLQGNNANIEGTEAYLIALNSSAQGLVEGARTLQSNYVQFHEAIEELASTLSGLLYRVSELSAAINTLAAEYEKLDDGINEYTGGVAQIVAGYTQVAEGSASLVTGSAALVDGSEILLDGSSDLADGSAELYTGSKELYAGTARLLSGIVEFYDAAGTLKDGTGELDDGAAKLLAGIADLYDGSGELKDGTSQLREETDGMDTEISDKIDEMLENICGSDEETVSFVSDKNTNVQSVQFVIQTEAVEIPEEEEVEEVEEKPGTFIEKLLRLFGIE